MKRYLLISALATVSIYCMEYHQDNSADGAHTSISLQHSRFESLKHVRSHIVHAHVTDQSWLQSESITILDLSNNKIKDAQIDVLKTLPHIKTCKLSHNAIEKVDIAAFFRTWPEIISIDLSHNNITDEGISWSYHPIWKVVTSRGKSLPLCHISLSGNILNSDTKLRLRERYKEELNRSLESLSLVNVDSCIVGLVYGITAGMGAAMYNLSIPCVSMSVGALTCACAPAFEKHRMSHNIEMFRPPIKFNASDRVDECNPIEIGWSHIWGEGVMTKLKQD